MEDSEFIKKAKLLIDNKTLKIKLKYIKPKCNNS
jgi:hypothetical protein